MINNTINMIMTIIIHIINIIINNAIILNYTKLY